jgi:hypothetical protein
MKTKMQHCNVRVSIKIARDRTTRNVGMHKKSAVLNQDDLEESLIDECHHFRSYGRST